MHLFVIVFLSALICFAKENEVEYGSTECQKKIAENLDTTQNENNRNELTQLRKYAETFSTSEMWKRAIAGELNNEMKEVEKFVKANGYTIKYYSSEKESKSKDVPYHEACDGRVGAFIMFIEKEITFCYSPENNLGETMDQFQHEVLHLAQFHQHKSNLHGEIINQLTFNHNGRSLPSERALSYSAAKSLDNMVESVLKRSKALWQSMGEKLKDDSDQLFQKLNELENIYFIKPIVSDGAIKKIDFSYRINPPQTEGQIKSRISYLIRTPSKELGDLGIKFRASGLVGPEFANWLYDSQSKTTNKCWSKDKSFQDAMITCLDTYKLELQTQVAQLGSTGSEKKKIADYFRVSYLENSCVEKLQIYCYETQANMQTLWKKAETYNRFKKYGLENICVNAPKEHAKVYESIAETADFSDADKKIEALTAEFVNKVYGRRDASILGFTQPLYTPENCRNPPPKSFFEQGCVGPVSDESRSAPDEGNPKSLTHSQK